MHYSLAMPEMPSMPETQIAFESTEVYPIYNVSVLVYYRILINSEAFLFLNKFYFFLLK